jgi:hypothetical protein
VLLVALAGVGFAFGLRSKHGSHSGPPSGAVVRVVLPTHSGSGFFVDGPDDFAYVVTANHVVDDGDEILVERTDASSSTPSTEAYPDVEVAAYDADADLAVLRVRVQASRFHALSLASAPVADEAILSYGFPASSLAKDAGIVSKPGKILSLVKFPVVDTATGTVMRNDAVDGLLVSSEIEPGFSGGPTCDDRGQVVGVNVTKDTVHRAQNGAVSVSAVRALLARVEPVAKSKDPSPDDVRALLERVQREYLLLPIERRSAVREQDFVSAKDLPRLRELVSTVERLEADTVRDEDTQISGQAMLGLVFARLPGRPLETYNDRTTRKALADCQVRQERLRKFFGSLVPGDEGEGATQAAHEKCAAVAFRPLAWDMTALALRWEGKERKVSVDRVESVDPGGRVYRASVRLEGIDYVVEVWVAMDGDRLRLKVFDADGQPAGLADVTKASASSLSGTWKRSEPRAAHDFGHGLDADTSTDETLVVSIGTDGAATVTHRLHRHVYFTGRFGCGGPKLDLGLEQSFGGPLQDSSIVAHKQKPPRAIGVDMARCGALFTYAPDQVAVLKRVGDKLLMYRTDGVSAPEVAEFER